MTLLEKIKYHINEKKCTCWKVYKRVPGTKPCSNNSCVKEQRLAEKKEHQNPTGGLSPEGRRYYNNKYGSNLKAPVTTPPSKLKAGSKAANRRKSFCARMGGVKGPMKDEKGRPTRKALALRKWNC